MLEFFSLQFIFFLALAFFALGALGSLVFRKNDQLANGWGNSLAILGSLAGILSAIKVLFGGAKLDVAFSPSLPLISFSFHVDKLSAFFIGVISLIVFLASIYGIGYVKHFYKKYNIGTLGFFYNAFIAGMLLVVTADNAIFFLVVWEIMSLASYFLVVYERKEKENVRAGSLYFVMTHIGTAFIMLAFLLFYKYTGSFDFPVIKENINQVPKLAESFIFLLALVGFGTKAGIIPLHVWLPSAHPAAPTHVSALMSGVMIKTGIYMFIRIFLDIMPNGPVWWGALILIVGAVSSLLGVLYALTEHDIKKLLAYHSIENIGIILLGLGGAMVFFAEDLKTLAILGLVAALFHTLNHAIFKALLFLGAGSVISQTHTRNMEEYGGLIRFMPYTAFFFLIGSMAISALPPFNGFFSEWAIFQTLFSGLAEIGFSTQWVFILGAGSLAFTGGLAAACFVKVFGATFLARPRSEEVKQAKESGMPMLLGMGVLAALTLLVGFFASPISKNIAGVVNNLGAFQNVESPFSSSLNSLQLQNGFAKVSMPIILLSLIVVFVVVFFAVEFLTRNRKVTVGRTWDCGTELGSRMEITATGFSRSIITIFRGILKPTKQTSIEYRDAEMRYFQKANVVKLEVKDIYGSYFYQPLQELLTKIAGFVKKIQSGNVNAYVLYIFLILIALLLFLTI
jgi:hydrogenase-4 component B